MLQQTFLSVWYWVFAALFWSAVCNSTFGAPNDLLSRAARGGEDARLFDRLARRNLERFSTALRRRAPWGAAIGGFALTLLGALAWRTGSEAALGLLVIVAPAAALSLWGGIALLRAADAPPEPEALRQLFQRARFAAAGAAAASMLAAVAVAGWRHGPDWTLALFRGF